jgi:hypothetical protein
MSYDRSKPLGSGMLRKDFKNANTGGWEQTLARWGEIDERRYRVAEHRRAIRLKQLELKKQEHERRRLQRDAARAA